MDASGDAAGQCYNTTTGIVFFVALYGNFAGKQHCLCNHHNTHNVRKVMTCVVMP